MDGNLLIRDLSFLQTIHPYFQLHIQPSEKAAYIHVMADNCIYYVVYKIPLHFVSDSVLPYYSLHGTEWIERLSLLKAKENITLSIDFRGEDGLLSDQHKNQCFLSATEDPSYAQTVRMELNECDTARMLDVVSIDPTLESTANVSTTTDCLLKWIQPCLDPTLAYTQISISSGSEWDFIGYDAENQDQLHIRRKNIQIRGSCRANYLLNMAVLVPFLSRFPIQPCELQWTIGRPMELKIESMVVYIAPHEQQKPQPSPSPPLKSRAKRKKIDPPPILHRD